MPIQVFGTPGERKKSLGTHLGEAALGFASEGLNQLNQGLSKRAEEAKKEEFRKAMKETYDVTIPRGASEKETLAIIGQTLAAKGKEQLLEKKRELIGNPLQGKGKGFGQAVREPVSPQGRPEAGAQTPQTFAGAAGQGEEFGTQEPPEEEQPMRPAFIPDEEIARIHQIDPEEGRFYQKMKADDQRAMEEEQKAENKLREVKSEREFKEKLITRAEDTELAKPLLQQANETLKKLPVLDQALEDIFTAAPEVGFRDWLADVTGFEPFRSKSGALFKTGVKDYFLGDVAKVGGRPNQWIEQQILQALPLAGRDPQSNMITAEGMKFKRDVEERRAQTILDLAENDRERVGWVEGLTLEKRANELLKPYVKQRQRELANRIKDIKQGKVKYEPPETKMIDVLGPNGEEYEIHISEVDQLPEGFTLK